ncbi:MAG: TetR family transcriptional regulator [Thermoanaerobaculia bacterium]
MSETDTADLPSLPGAATEERIFEAALTVFAKKGKDGARMQEIADLAGINKAMLHYYFRSKDRLYAQVFAYVFRRFGQVFSEAIDRSSTRSFAEALRDFISGYGQLVATNRDVMRLFVNELLAGGETARAALGPAIASGQAPPQRFIALVSAAVARGEIVPVDPLQLTMTVISGCIFPWIALPLVSALVSQAGQNPERFFAERQEELFQQIYRGLMPRSEPTA